MRHSVSIYMYMYKFKFKCLIIQNNILYIALFSNVNFLRITYSLFVNVWPYIKLMVVIQFCNFPVYIVHTKINVNISPMVGKFFSRVSHYTNSFLYSSI